MIGAAPAIVAVVFDMDGVLIDSEPIFRRAAQGAAQDLGEEMTDDFYEDLIGLPGTIVEARILARFGADFELPRFRDRFRAHWHRDVTANGVPAKPGVTRFIEELRALRIPFGVATSTHGEAADLSLRLAGLRDAIEVMVCGDEVVNGKPAPDIFAEAARRIGVQPMACAAIEDSPVGVEAAASAGMYTIMVPDLKQPDATVRARAHEVLPSMAAAARRILALIGE